MYVLCIYLNLSNLLGSTSSIQTLDHSAFLVYCFSVHHFSLKARPGRCVLVGLQLACLKGKMISILKLRFNVWIEDAVGTYITRHKTTVDHAMRISRRLTRSSLAGWHEYLMLGCNRTDHFSVVVVRTRTATAPELRISMKMCCSNDN